MTEMLHLPVTDRSAWKVADMERDRSWVYELTADALAEIDGAIAAVGARGLRAGEFAAADFDLPILKGVMRSVLDQVQNGRGAALIRGLPVEKYDADVLSSLLWGLGIQIGRPLPQRASLNLGGVRDNLIAHITDQGLDYNAPNVNGSATSAEQLPHTDPADVVALLCVRKARSGGISRVVSAVTLHNDVLERAPDLLGPLYDGYLYDMRGDAANSSGQEVTDGRIPIFTYHAGKLSCVFNAKMIETAQRKLGTALPMRERAALDLLLERALAPENRLDMDLQPGDLQIISNYTMLHARTGWVEQADPALRRLMLRLWLRVEGFRDIAPGVASGYVRGSTVDVGAAAAQY
ncbi:TfdA family taurine catabolism dioxygenase TauD [Stella humosa]|uniref:TfdA family taurine catabolism dioxygenase TauD n=1 Tax=Stella humosa TaxID=94 RepID=A0A3N1L0I4_9PROT|nr:TauD/TfdA family dioxygenase [Stella humosa]ROP84539.1 TfdA family taurine catabolism dioxygenase TauD [Stella humosa]BBK34059.1 hypothetical protein STHU_46930 [Stella humosa]